MENTIAHFIDVNCMLESVRSVDKVLWDGVCGRSVEGQVYHLVECLNGNIGQAARRH